MLEKGEASILLEEVLDTLIEVGNGTTEEHLHEAVDRLSKFRDEYFMWSILQNVKKVEKILEKGKADILLKEVLDTLCEVKNSNNVIGHGTGMPLMLVYFDNLHEAADKLFKFRDEYFRQSILQNN